MLVRADFRESFGGDFAPSPGARSAGANLRPRCPSLRSRHRARRRRRRWSARVVQGELMPREITPRARQIRVRSTHEKSRVTPPSPILRRRRDTSAVSAKRAADRARRRSVENRIHIIAAVAGDAFGEAFWWPVFFDGDISFSTACVLPNVHRVCFDPEGVLTSGTHRKIRGWKNGSEGSEPSTTRGPGRLK